MLGIVIGAILIRNTFVVGFVVIPFAAGCFREKLRPVVAAVGAENKAVFGDCGVCLVGSVAGKDFCAFISAGSLVVIEDADIPPCEVLTFLTENVASFVSIDSHTAFIIIFGIDLIHRDLDSFIICNGENAEACENHHDAQCKRDNFLHVINSFLCIILFTVYHIFTKCQ